MYCSVRMHCVFSNKNRQGRFVVVVCLFGDNFQIFQGIDFRILFGCFLFFLSRVCFFIVCF